MCSFSHCFKEASKLLIFLAVFHDTKTIVTPALDSGTILPGSTRSSIIELARSELGWNVEERNLNISEVKSADEAFCCGTGASITPVGVVNYLHGCFDDEDVGLEKTNDFEVIFKDDNSPRQSTIIGYMKLNLNLRISSIY